MADDKTFRINIDMVQRRSAIVRAPSAAAALRTLRSNGAFELEDTVHDRHMRIMGNPVEIEDPDA